VACVHCGSCSVMYVLPSKLVDAVKFSIFVRDQSGQKFRVR
jgi:hypothetical protein